MRIKAMMMLSLWLLRQLRRLLQGFWALLLGNLFVCIRQKKLRYPLTGLLTVLLLVIWVTSLGFQLELGEGPWFWVLAAVQLVLLGYITGRLTGALCFYEVYTAHLLQIVFIGVAVRRLGYVHNVLLLDRHFWRVVEQMLSGSLLVALWPLWLFLAFVLVLVSQAQGYIHHNTGFWYPRDRHLTQLLTQAFLTKSAAGQRSQLFVWISLVGVILGSCALMTVTAVMSGYQRNIENKILATNAHIVLQKYGLDFSEYQEIITQTQHDQRILGASPFVFNEAMAQSRDQTAFVLVKGIDLQLAAQQPEMKAQLLPLAYPNDNLAVANAVLGKVLAEKLGVHVGDNLELLAFLGSHQVMEQAPSKLAVKVSGLFVSGMYEFDARLLYLPLTVAQKLFAMKQRVSGIELRLHPDRVAETENVSQQLLNTLGHYPYHALAWQELNRSIFTALKLQKMVMFLVLSFMCIVASFNIAATLFILVAEQASAIAILLAMGAAPASIIKIFLHRGVRIGLVGSLTGIGMGWLLCQLLSWIDLKLAAEVYMVGHVHVAINPLEVGYTLVTSVLIAYLASLYPAVYAAKQKPVVLLAAG